MSKPPSIAGDLERLVARNQQQDSIARDVDDEDLPPLLQVEQQRYIPLYAFMLLFANASAVKFMADSRLAPSQWDTSLQGIMPSRIGWAQT